MQDVVSRASSIARVLAGAVGALVLAGPAGAAGEPVRVAILGTDVSSGPLYAQTSGAFARARLDVRLQPYVKGFEPLDAVRDGKADIGFTNVVSAVNAIEGGMPVTIVAPAALYDSANPITVMVAAKARPVRSGADLNGKLIAVPAPNDLGEIATRNWIDKHGGNAKTVRYTTSVPFGEIAEALNQGRADAAEISEPVKTEVASKVSFAAATFDDIAPRFAIGVFVARNDWLHDHADEARRFVSAMSDGARWANTHHAETAAALAARYHTKPDVLATMVRATYPERLTPDLIQPVIDVAARYGIVKPIRAETLLSFLNGGPSGGS